MLRRNAAKIRRLWHLSYPLIGANLAQVLLVLADTAILAGYSDTALAALAVGASVNMVAVMTLRGFATAVQIAVARSSGPDRESRRSAVGTVGIGMAGVLGLVLGVAQASLAIPLSEVLAADPDIARQAAAYLIIVAFAVPIQAVTGSCIAEMTGRGITYPAMRSVTAVVVTGIPLSAGLTYGADLGIHGSAIGTVLAALAGLIVAVLHRRRAAVTASMRSLEMVSLIRRVAALGWPESAFLFVGYVVEFFVVGIVSRLGPAALGAYRILDNVTVVLYCIASGVGSAVAVAAAVERDPRDGNTVAGHGAAGILLSLGLTVPLVVAVSVFPSALPELLSDDVRVVSEAAGATFAAVVGMIPLIVALVVAGLLRSRGKNRAILAGSVIGDVVALLPLAWLLGIAANGGLAGVFLAWAGYGAALLLYLSLRYRRIRETPDPTERTT